MPRSQSHVAAPLRPHVRWLIRRDMPEVLAIERESFAYHWIERDIIRDLQRSNTIGMVAEHDDRVVGYMIYELKADRIIVERFAVAADCRRRGVGRAMRDKLVGKLSAQRRRSIVVHVWEGNLAGQLFWRAMGFRAVRVLPAHFPGGQDAYEMRYRWQG